MYLLTDCRYGTVTLRKHWMVSLMFLLWPLTGHAATISGYVRDAAEGEALPAVVITLEDTGLGTLSDDDGWYLIRNVPPGTQVLLFSRIGFQSRRDTLSIAAGQDVTLDAELSSESIRIDTETVVRGRAPDTERTPPSAPLQIQLDQIRQVPAAGEPDLLRSLQLLPGIQSASDISSGLYIRGGGPDQNLILLDHMPVYNPSHAFGFFSTFNPDAVQEASLYKGAYPAPYNANLGAVLTVTNRGGNLEEFSGRGGISLISARMMASGPAANGSWMLAGRRTYLDPVLAGLRRAGVDVPDYYFADLNARLEQQVGNRNNLTVSAFLSQDDLRFESDRETFFDLGWGNRALSVRWNRVLRPALLGRVLAGYSAYHSTTEASIFDTPVLLSNSIRDFTLRLDADYFASPRHTWTLGAGITGYRIDFDQVFNQETLAALDETPVMATAYVEDEWQLDALTTVRLGVRTNYYSTGDDVAVMPRLGFSRKLRANLRLTASTGTYRQYLQLISTEGFSGGDYWVPLDRSVSPGRATQGVVGLEWEPSTRYRATVETYYAALADLVLLDNNVAVDSRDTSAEALFRTGGTGYATGVEVFAERRTGRLTGFAGYTLGWTRRRFAGLNQGRSFPPKYDRRHDASVVLTYARQRYTWGATFVYGTGQAFTPAVARYTLRAPATGIIEDYVLPADRNSARLLPYHRLDVGVRRAVTLLGAPAEIYLQIFNLYSRRNEWFVQYDTSDPATSPEIVRMLPVVPTFGVDFAF